jgi:hypothetical protein
MQFGDLNRAHVFIGETDVFEPYLDDSMGTNLVCLKLMTMATMHLINFNTELLLPLGDLLSTGKVNCL